MSDASTLYGTEHVPPPARRLVAGRLSASFVDGGLRDIRYDGHEVLRGLAYVVRGKDWDSPASTMRDLSIAEGEGGFTIRYAATCSGAQTLDSTVEIVATATQLVFTVIAVPRDDFLTARTGFAVLHPGHLAGRALTVTHTDGGIEGSVFPELLEPWQPFKDIRRLTHTVADGVSADVLMEGDVFEMEDQRNWSDDSYKTYVRPIELPWPYTLPAAVENRQSVTLTLRDTRTAPEPAPAPPAQVTLTLGAETGTMPRIGVLVEPEGLAQALAAPALLDTLGPQLLVLHLDAQSGRGLDRLDAAAALADRFPGETQLEIAADTDRPLEQSLGALARQIDDAGLQPDAIMLCPGVDRQSTPPGSVWPPCPPLENFYRAARAAFPAPRLGGGMLSYFPELNRKRPPVALLDFVSHCTNPIVHAADDDSVMQTLRALPAIFRTARSIVGDAPYRIGPSTIGMRQNPYGSRTMDNPDQARVAMAHDDPRQRGLFAAAWMVGYLAATEAAGIDSVTVGALTGPRGMVGEAGVPHPAFHAAQAMAQAAGLPRLACVSDDPDRLGAIAVRKQGGARLCLANLTALPLDVRLPGAASALRLLAAGHQGFATYAAPGDIVSLPAFAVADVVLQGA